MNKNGILAILGTGLLVALIFVFSNFNIQVNVNGANQQTAQAAQGSQAGSMDSMHGGAQAAQGGSMDSMHGGPAPAADSTLFNSLINKPAPDFSLESYDGSKISLSSLKGKNVILFFNEGLMCYPACWNQIAAFGKNSDLAKKAVILNVEVSSPSDWKQAIDKMPELAQATLLFDTNSQVSGAYGVLTVPSSMHKGQFPGHSYVVIDKSGIVRYLKDDENMGIENTELSSVIDKL